MITCYGGKELWKMVLNFLRKKKVETSETGEEVTWCATWHMSDGRLFHKTGAEWYKEMFAILWWKVREGRIRVIRDKYLVERCEGNERRERRYEGWPVLRDLYVREQTLYLSWASGDWLIDWLIDLRPVTVRAIWTVDLRLRSTPTNGHPSKYWPDSTLLSFSDQVSEQALFATADLWASG